LRVVRTVYTRKEVPVEYLVALYPPERYQVIMSLTKEGDGERWTT
jgi:DNA-binding GntR family transcriptional regulator